MKIEHIIRDWLVENPDFIEVGLKVVEREHYLPDEIGTSGFVDILCSDIYNNFVIVEIKRSDSAARQTFTEVLKYAQLIKNRYNARNSEIRIIIVSTHWDEIIQAFSNLCFDSPYAIKGFQIDINEQTKIPERKEEIVPISSRLFAREFMPSQMMYLFTSEDKRQEAHKVLNQKLQLANASDYVLVGLDAPASKKIIYPYAINAAFQRISQEELLQMITLLDGEDHLDMEAEEFENEVEYLNYLEEVFIISLEMRNYVDDIEAGYAEKFESVTSIQGWEISSISRSGIFKTDPRYTDELLIKELKGHAGRSANKFVGFSESTQKERLKEIKLECQHSLNHTPDWAEFIDYILSDLQNKKEKFKVVVDIYNPDSIIKAFYFTLKKGDPHYLPLFLLIVDYIDENKVEIYRGEIKSIGIEPRLKLFTSTDGSGVYDEIVSSMLIPDNEIDAFRMGLRYVISKTEIVDGKELSELFVDIVENTVVPDNSKYYSLEEYFMTNKSSIALMLKNYGRFAFHA